MGRRCSKWEDGPYDGKWRKTLVERLWKELTMSKSLREKKEELLTFQAVGGSVDGTAPPSTPKPAEGEHCGSSGNMGDNNNKGSSEY